jgi:hypothetical protein
MYMNILAAIRREESKLEKQVGRLQRQMDVLRAAALALGGAASAGVGKTRKRVLSATGRARISAAAKRRWAKVRAGTKKVALPNAAGGSGKARKRMLSREARARISAAMKKRWANVRAGGKKKVT